MKTAAAFLDEARIMNRLRHPNPDRLLGVCTLEEPIYIITELMSVSYTHLTLPTIYSV